MYKSQKQMTTTITDTEINQDSKKETKPEPVKQQHFQQNYDLPTTNNNSKIRRHLSKAKGNKEDQDTMKVKIRPAENFQETYGFDTMRKNQQGDCVELSVRKP